MPEEATKRISKSSKPGVFADEMTEFVKYMSPKRWELLQDLRTYGPKTIRRLAMDLYRDHQSVRKDIRELQHVGLIDESEDGMSFFVPWDEISCEASLILKKPK